jgi:hypothetical protein
MSMGNRKLHTHSKYISKQIQTELINTTQQKTVGGRVDTTTELARGLGELNV